MFFDIYIEGVSKQVETSEVLQRQNADVLGQMQRKREYTSHQMEEISYTISKVHVATTGKVEIFLNGELDRVDKEIEQLELQLIEKYAERRQFLQFIRHVGYQEGMQIHVEGYLEGKEGEISGPRHD